MAWPGGSTWIGGVMVSGAGTYWKARYLRSAAASRSRSPPGSASALRSEAKRSLRSTVPGTPATAGRAAVARAGAGAAE